MKINGKVIDNTVAKRFELHVDGHTAYIDYRVKEDKIFPIHTEVPKALGGKGIGSSLVKQTLEEVEKQKLKAVPLCSFVSSYIDRHPEWEKIR